MGMSSTCVLKYAMPSLQRCMPCIFVISVVTSTSMQTRLRDVSDFRDSNLPKSVTAVILLPCIHVSTERSMPLLSMFRKDDFEILLCSIHPCPWLQLWSAIACLNVALRLL